MISEETLQAQQDPSKPALVAVLGPTASGKTALGEQLALVFGGEIVSVDAKQVYRGMDIGTAKERELQVSQHLIDVKDPGTKITVAEYQAMAYAVIDELHARGQQPFLVGGSMLYAEAVLNGYTFLGSSEASEAPRYRVLKLGIALEKDELRKRVATRTNRWIEEGLLHEIQRLRQAGVSREWLMQCGQEYRYFTAYLEGEISLAEAAEQTNRSLKEYIKRQYTWWRRHPDFRWVSGFSEAQACTARFIAGESMLY